MQFYVIKSERKGNNCNKNESRIYHKMHLSLSIRTIRSSSYSISEFLEPFVEGKKEVIFFLLEIPAQPSPENSKH